MQDLLVALDDADGRILYARFVPQENTAAVLAALKHVLTRYGRFSELQRLLDTADRVTIGNILEHVGDSFDWRRISRHKAAR
jgi:hypothetical protein